MDLSFRFDPWIRRVPASPRDEGTLMRILLRPQGGRPGERMVVDRVRASASTGLEGDRWSLDETPDPGAQVSLVNVRWLEALTRGGSDEQKDLAGDNLHVDLDLSEENLPVGARLAIGTAVLEISPNFHRPCRSFLERLGAPAAKRVARAGRLGLRGRGVLATVVQDGEMNASDTIHVISR